MMRYNSNRLFYDQPPLTGWNFIKKYVKLKLYDLKFRVTCAKNCTVSEKPNYISLCTIFKNEAPFLKEWLEFHLLMGVNHFYMYNNNSTDDFMSVLKPYIDKGIVTLTEWPEVPGQLSAYKHFYSNYRHESQWVSFLDMDEFICPREAKDIPTWLQDYKQYPVIMLYWRMFGTSGKMEHDFSKPVVEQYTVCWDKYDTCGKLFWNTDYDIENMSVGMMHYFNVIKDGIIVPPVNVWKYFVKDNIHRIDDDEPSIQVNHYWSKAFHNYEKKQKKGSAAFGQSWKTFDQFLRHEQNNISSDYVIYRFLTQLKLKLSGKYPNEQQ